MDLCLGWIRSSRGNPGCSLQACAETLQPQLQQAGKLPVKRLSSAETCFVILLGLGMEGGKRKTDKSQDYTKSLPHQKFSYRTKVQKWSSADGQCRL